MTRQRVAVIGAGIAGLSAAYELTLADADVDVVVYEAADRVGGKIRTTPFAGLAVDEGADAFLARVPWARELCEELGLDRDFVSPANGHAYIYSRGALRKIPQNNLLGVPLDLDELAASGIVSSEAVAIARLDLDRAVDIMPPSDESIGSLISRRLGREINERLVDPLIGGIYAGDTDHLSLRATAPQFADAASRDASLIRALRETRRDALAAAPERPVFYGLRGGTQVLCDALHTRLGARVCLSTEVTNIDSNANGYVLGLGGERVHVDGVVIATPTYAASKLLAPVAGRAAELCRSIHYASVVLVTMAVSRDSVEHPLDASGFLVPKNEQRFITACSWTSTKWAHLNPEREVLFRVSAGHVGDPHAVNRADGDVMARILGDLRDMMGKVGTPSETRITRWHRSFPQYRPGHLELVSSLQAHLCESAPHIEVTGAAYGGIGIPATVHHARDAAARLLCKLGRR